MEVNSDFFKPIYDKIKEKCLITVFLVLKSKKFPKCIIKFIIENFIVFPIYEYTRLVQKSGYPGKNEKSLILDLNSKKTYFYTKDIKGSKIAIFHGLFYVNKSEYYSAILNLMMKKNLINLTKTYIPVFSEDFDQIFVYKMINSIRF